MFHIHKRTAAILSTLAVVAIVAGAAYAYFSATPHVSGTVTAQTGNGGTVEISASATPITNVVPDGTVHQIALQLSNPSDGPVTLTQFPNLAVADTGNPGCQVPWFTVTQGSAPVMPTVPAHSTITIDTAYFLANGGGTMPTLAMPASATTNQDACRNVTLTLSVS